MCVCVCECVSVCVCVCVCVGILVFVFVCMYIVVYECILYDRCPIPFSSIYCYILIVTILT